MEEPTEKENLINMQRCPRFSECSIPKCPLDYRMSERAEFPDEEVCVLRKSMGNLKSKRMKGIFSQTMKGLAKFIPSSNK